MRVQKTSPPTTAGHSSDVKWDGVGCEGVMRRGLQHLHHQDCRSEPSIYVFVDRFSPARPQSLLFKP